MGLSLISKKVCMTLTIIGFRLHSCGILSCGKHSVFASLGNTYLQSCSTYAHTQNSHSSMVSKHSSAIGSHPAGKHEYLTSQPGWTTERMEAQSRETTELLKTQSMETTEIMESQSRQTTGIMESELREATSLLETHSRETTAIMESQSRETTEILETQSRETADMILPSGETQTTVLESDFNCDAKSLIDTGISKEHQDSGILPDMSVDSVDSLLLDMSQSERLSPRLKTAHGKEELPLSVTSQKVIHMDGCSESSADNLLSSSGSACSKFQLLSSRKPTVLPETLLKKVTSIVQQDSSCISQIKKTAKKSRGSKRGKSAGSGKGATKKGSSEYTEGDRSPSSHSPLNVFAPEDNECEEGDQQASYRDVFGISPLFSAKFDKEYQKFEKNEKRRKKKKWKKKDLQPGEADVEGDDAGVRKSTIPNHFISIQITNSKIHEAAAEVQKAILDGEKHLQPTLIPLPTLHLTLMVMRLETEDDMARAKLALDDSSGEYRTKYATDEDLLELELAGLGHFQHGVLFAKITPGPQLEELQRIVENVEKRFAEQNIEKADKRGFQPHVTLVKLSKGRKKLWKKGIKKIKPELYADFLDTNFGSERVKGIQLCSMVKRKNEETGYYHIEHEVLFGNSARSEERRISDHPGERPAVGNVPQECIADNILPDPGACATQLLTDVEKCGAGDKSHDRQISGDAVKIGSPDEPKVIREPDNMEVEDCPRRLSQGSESTKDELDDISQSVERHVDGCSPVTPLSGSKVTTDELSSNMEQGNSDRQSVEPTEATCSTEDRGTRRKDTSPHDVEQEEKTHR